MSYEVGPDPARFVGDSATQLFLSSTSLPAVNGSHSEEVENLAAPAADRTPSLPATVNDTEFPTFLTLSQHQHLHHYTIGYMHPDRSNNPTIPTKPHHHPHHRPPPSFQNPNPTPLPTHSIQPLLLLPRLRLLRLHLLPPHEIACRGEEQRIDDEPGY